MNSAIAFTRHALSARYEDLPADAVSAAKTFILDTVGVGVAGAKAPYANEVFQAAQRWGVGDGAHVLARGAMLSAANAAFVNGFQIHCQEFDCVHEPAVVHPMATVFAALIAEAEASTAQIGGREFITAIAVAVDAAAGLGVAAKSGIRFFRPATAGIFGATLGVARLRGFDEEQALDALGYALGFASGTMQAHVEGKPALPVQIGNAARGAIAACDTAGVGLPGPHDVFEGPFGYLTLFEAETELAPVIASLGSVWRIAEVSHKPFPTGRAAQGGICAVLGLREQGLSAQNLVRLKLTAPPLIQRLVGRQYQEDMAVNYARLCFAYCGAVALVHGTVGLRDFSQERLRDPEVAEVARKIVVIDDKSSDPAAFTPQRAVARKKDGGELTMDVKALYGSPLDPMPHKEHLEKFRSCLTFGLGENADRRAEEIISFAEELETRSDIVVLSHLAAGSRE